MREELLEIGREVADLPHPVAVGNHGQDRLVESAAQDLDPARLDQAANLGDVLGVLLDQPFQERSGGVQGERDLRIVFQHVQKRAIAVAIGLLEDAVEIAHRLVVVQGEDQANGGHKRASCEPLAPVGRDIAFRHANAENEGRLRLSPTPGMKPSPLSRTLNGGGAIDRNAQTLRILEARRLDVDPSVSRFRNRGSSRLAGARLPRSNSGRAG